MKKKFNENPFYGEIFRLFLPIVVQNLLSAMVNSADVIMLNYVGQSAISAVSLGVQYSSILYMIFYGLGTGITMLCAQYYGKGDLQAIRAVEGIAMRFSITMSVLFASAVGLFPRQLMHVFTDDPELIDIGASYLRSLSLCYLCWGIAETYLATLRSMGRVVISTCLNMLAFAANIFLNAVFIFGLFGAPRLGAMGVALATSLSRLLELIGCLIVSARTRDVKLDLRYMFIKNQVLFRDFVKMSLPALANDIVWSVGFSMYSVILGHLGTDAVAANSLAVVVKNFGTILCFGMASAGGILIGNLIGERRMEEAREGAGILLRLTVVCGVIGGLIVLAARPFVLMYADLSGQAMHYLSLMLLINSYYIMGAAVNTTLICGTFRAGGDSRFGFICDALDMWAYAVPVGFIAAFVLKLPVMAVYFLLCTDEFVKWPAVIAHYRSKKWLNNITREHLFEKE